MHDQKDTSLCLELLRETNMFKDDAKRVFECAIKKDTLPHEDFEYLLFVLKLEKNLDFMVHSEANEKIHALEKKYKQHHEE